MESLVSSNVAIAVALVFFIPAAALQIETGSGCRLPPSLKLSTLRNGSSAMIKGPPGPDDRNKLLDAIASPRAKETPFLWLHYGDVELKVLSQADTAWDQEGADYGSKCIKRGLTEMMFGEESGKRQDGIVIQALGTFFLCSKPSLSESVEQFLKTHRASQYVLYDDFYLPVGTPTDNAQSSWVVAAKEGKRPVVLVGPKHLDSLNCMLGHVAYFQIPLPTKGCGDVDRLVPKIVDFSLTKYPEQSVMIVVAGGIVGKMIAYQAFKQLHHKDFIVDVGASMDGYAGQHSRDYNRDSSKICKHSMGWVTHNVCVRECGGVSKSEGGACCPPKQWVNRRRRTNVV